MSAGSRFNELVELRRRREQRALDLVIAQNERCRNAERSVESTEAAASRHAVAARERERSLLGPLLGHAVQQNAVTRVQSEIDRLALETERLWADAASAQASLLDERKAYAEAQKNFRLRQKAALKLTLVLQQEANHRSFRQTALAEVEDEDRGAAIAERSK